MWPGEQQQPGGQPNPQPYGGQPPQPYGQSGYPPATPPHYGGQPPYGGPAFGGRPPQQPPPRRKTSTVVIAVAAAIVVIAAGVTAVLLTRGGGGKPVAGGSSSAPAPASPSQDGPRDSADKPVVPGWQVVANAEHQVAYDVPRDWAVQATSWFDEFTDVQGDPEIAVTGAAHYREKYCGGESPLAGTGVRGHKTADSLADAARSDARTAAYYGFNDFKGPKGKLTSTPPVPFSDAFGIKGYLATASENFGATGKCAKNGMVYVIAWLNSHHQVSEWVLWTGTGVAQTPGAVTVKTIEASIRSDS
jgi:hypothetical protein